MEQATKFARSLARGEPGRLDILATTVGDRIREMV
jgi:hypothetical protein